MNGTGVFEKDICGVLIVGNSRKLKKVGVFVELKIEMILGLN
jgi:hypothetical protein